MSDVENGTVLAWFSAVWCQPCKVLARHMEKVEPTLSFPVVKIDVDEQPDLQSRYGIQSVPTLLVLQDGAAVGRVESRTAPKLIAELKQYQ